MPECIQTATCRVCGAKRLRLLSACKDFSDTTLKSFGKDGLPRHACGQLYVCGNCGIGLRSPCLTEAELKRLYSAAPAKQMQYTFQTNGAWVAAGRHLANVYKHEDGISVVDIGCNEGIFLDALPKAWSKSAFEPSKAASEIASSKGIEIIGSFLEDVPPSMVGKYDVACMFDVFEHLLNPAKTIAEAMKLLKSNGQLLISTGNMDAWTWRWLKTCHWYLEIPFHITFARKPFFRWFESAYKYRMTRYTSIAHRIGHSGRFSDGIVALYYGCRQRGGVWRGPQRLMQTIPALSWLRHKQTMPATFSLKDHVMIVLQK